ncbi:MAG: SDR family NAD(P)-dependent oxidoreductase [Myxococcota bacterium]
MGVSFRDQVVLITGARGLGLEVARIFAREGAKLALLARDEGELERAAAELRASGAAVCVVPCDVSKADQVEAAVAIVVAEHGSVDVLVNNAGIIEVGPFEHMRDADFEAAMGVHFWGPLNLIQAALPHLRRRGGRIVNVASIGGLVPVPHMLPYVASKFALVGLSEGLRVDLSGSGVSVTTVCPGLMRTGSFGHALFKGRHEAEYAWFSVASSFPFVTMSSQRAAKRVVEATRSRTARVTLMPWAKLLVFLHAVAPGLLTGVLGLGQRFLPAPGGADGEVLVEGRRIELPSSVSALLGPGRDAAARNNE